MTADIPQLARRQLPKRRPSELHDIVIGGQTYAVGISFFDDGTIGEVFISGARTGSELDGLLADGAILASLGLQFGVPPAALSKSMSRLATGPFEAATNPASVLGATMDLLAQLSLSQDELGDVDAETASKATSTSQAPESS